MSSFGASGGADPFSSLAQQPAGPDWPNMVSPHVLRGRSRSNNSPPLGLNQNNGSEQAPRGEIPGEAAASAGNNNAAAAAMAVGIPAENNHHVSVANRRGPGPQEGAACPRRREKSQNHMLWGHQKARSVKSRKCKYISKNQHIFSHKKITYLGLWGHANTKIDLD